MKAHNSTNNLPGTSDNDTQITTSQTTKTDNRQTMTRGQHGENIYQVDLFNFLIIFIF